MIIIKKGWLSMKKTFYQYLAFLLLVVMTLTSCGRSLTITGKNDESKPTEKESSISSDPDDKPDEKDNDDQSNSKEAKAEQKKFNEFSDTLFKETVSENLLSVHSVLDFPKEYGITEYEHSLGDLSHESSEAFYDQIRGYIKELKDFNYDLLTDEQKLTYDIMITDLTDSLKFEDYYLFDDYLSPLNGMPSSLPSYLGQFTFHTADDIDDYLEILELMPDYFDQIIDYQTEKTDAGMGMPDFEIDEIIDQCNEFVQDPDNHFLITSFDERIDELSSLSDSEKTSYKSKNANIIKNTIIPLYQNFPSKLEPFKGKGTNEGGLCGFEGGKDYYELLFRSETAIDKSVDEVKTLLEDKFTKDLSDLSVLMYKDSELEEKMEEYDFDTSDPDKILQYLLEHIKDDFPAGYETNYTLHDVPKSLEKYQSPAYYYIPSIDNVTVNNIFINRYTDYADMDLYPVLAHEGFPGHMYQSTYFQNTNPDPVRSIFRYTGYVEGWGLYAELYSYDLSGQESNVAKFNRVLNYLSYDIYCFCDIGVNYEGWTKEDTIDYVTSIGYDEETALDVYTSMVENPCVYMTYYMGYLEFMDMKDTAKEELGDLFDAKEFHKFLLDIGPAQFEIIHDRFDTWLEDQKTNA